MIAWLLHRILRRVPVLTDDREQARLHHAIQGALHEESERLTYPDDCGCRLLWDGDADRGYYVPCDTHRTETAR